MVDYNVETLEGLCSRSINVFELVNFVVWIRFIYKHLPQRLGNEISEFDLGVMNCAHNSRVSTHILLCVPHSFLFLQPCNV